MESIWGGTVEIPGHQRLTGDITADAVVIGGGIAGVLTAYFLQEAGTGTVLLEAKRLFGGQTRNTTAKITLQHGLIYDKLLNNIGREKAALYAQANREAIERYRSIVEAKGIDCGFHECSAYLYSAPGVGTISEGAGKAWAGAGKAWAGVGELKREEAAAAALGIRAEYTTRTELAFPVKGALCYPGQAQFHPLLFLKEIAKGLTIYENTPVIRVEGHEVITPQGNVRAEQIVFATHYPFINVPGFYFMRMHQERSYVLALENTAPMDNLYYGIDEGGLSFRKYGDILLLGGGNHRTGHNREGGKYRELRSAAERLYPGCREAARWSAQDCMPVDDIPYIGRYSAARPYWYVATGFKKWGMTSAMAAGSIISELIIKGKSPYEEVFTPQRLNVKASAARLAEDMAESAKGLGKGLVPGARRCPHMGCALEWNPDERSWDCPCHGSRFDGGGKLIDNPAQIGLKDLKNKK